MNNVENEELWEDIEMGDDHYEEEHGSDAEAENSLAEAVDLLEVDEPVDLEDDAPEDEPMPDYKIVHDDEPVTQTTQQRQNTAASRPNPPVAPVAHGYYDRTGDCPAWIWPRGTFLFALPEVPPPSVKFQRLARNETWATYDGPVSNVWFFSVRYMTAQDQGFGVWLVNPALATGHWEGPEIPEYPADTPIRVQAKCVARRIIRAFAGDFGHDTGFGPGKPWELKTDDVKLAAAVADFFRFDYNGARDMAEHVGVLNGEEAATMNAVWDDLVGNFDREHMSMPDMVKDRMGKAVKGPDYDIHKISLGVAPVSNLGEPVPYVLPAYVEDRDEEYRLGFVADSNTLDERWM